MRRQVWIVRVTFVLVAVGLGAMAVEARRSAETGGEDRRGVAGVTGQRQAIEFEVDGDGEPRAFHTVLYLHCSGGDEWNVGWSPHDGAPVPFDWRGGRLRVREESRRDFEDGSSGTGVATMDARVATRGVEGRIRSVWRFERPGGITFCDSGFVPFAVGPGARRRLDGIPRSAEPWSLYPEDAEVAAPPSLAQARFTRRVDRACMLTWQQRPGTRAYPEYVRWHEWQWSLVVRLGMPPQRRLVYRRWLANMRRRVLLERDALESMRRGELAAAARIQAELSAMKARGNAEGLRAGLVTCTSNGPTGAPKS